MRVIGGRSYLSPRGNWALWYAFISAPLIWTVNLFVVFFAVPSACATGSTLSILAVDAISLGLVAFAGITAYSIWSDAGEELPGEHATRTDRSRLMVVIGMMLSSLIALILIGHIAATLVLGPCIPLPRVRFTPDAVTTPTLPPLADAR